MHMCITPRIAMNIVRMFNILYSGDCGDLPLRTDVYTIKEGSNNTSIVEFYCVKDTFIKLNDNNSLLLTFCLSNGRWYPNPNDVCTPNERKGSKIDSLIFTSYSMTGCMPDVFTHTADVTGSSVIVYVTVATVFAVLFFFGTFTVLSATVCLVYKIKKARGRSSLEYP